MSSSSLSHLSVSAEIRDILATSLVWDNHACMPLRPADDTFLVQLERYRTAGVDVVTLNVGFDAMPWENTVAMLAQFRRWIGLRSQHYLVVEEISDLERARREHKLAVTFDIEGGCALHGQLDMVQAYYDLGVRWMLIAYNKNNALGGGCNDDDSGLTPFGVRVLEEMARVGMVVCCSHTGHRTAMQVMERAPGPVILSHSNPAGVCNHFRNVPDELIRACAASGGVIGINGVGQFLGTSTATVEAIVRHIDYVATLVGAEHVGLALDYVFDLRELDEQLRANPHIFSGMTSAGADHFLSPEQIPSIAEALHRRGYSRDDLRGILGGNHLRIARQVWK